MLTQHKVERQAHNRMRVLHRWRAAAEQIRAEHSAALRQQHVWDRVSGWLMGDDTQ